MCLHNMAFSFDTENPNLETDSHSFHRLYTMRDPEGVTHILSETTSERDLGVIIDNKLSWQHHIDRAIAKAPVKKKPFDKLRHDACYLMYHTFQSNRIATIFSKNGISNYFLVASTSQCLIYTTY